MIKKLTKMEFKNMYMNYRSEGDGWSDDYWDSNYESQDGKQYFFTAPQTPEDSRMFISEDQNSVHLFFMSLESEESLFDYPGKE